MENKSELTEEEKLIEKEADDFFPVKKEKKNHIENIIEQTKKKKAIS